MTATVGSRLRRVEVVRHGPSVGGLHQAGRLIADLLRAAGCSVVETVVPDDGPAMLPATGRGLDLRVACVNADQFHRVPAVDGVPLVGWWSWELSVFPRAFALAAEGLTAVWTLSSQAAEALQSAVRVPVRVLPLPVPAWPAAERMTDGFTVLVVGDHASGSARKNLSGSVRAYCEAFGPDDGAELVVKTAAGAAHPGAARRLSAWAARRPDVQVVDGRLPRAAFTALVDRTTVVLSLHRAEGYGLPIAEAMSAGAVAVATAYGGPADFMTARNSVPVPYRLRHVGLGHWPYPPSAVWAEPDRRSAVLALRSLQRDPDLRSSLRAQAAQDLSLHHSLAVRAELAVRLVDEALALGPGAGSRSLGGRRRSAGRLLAGGLHRADLRSGGAWAAPVVALDGVRYARSRAELHGVARSS